MKTNEGWSQEQTLNKVRSFDWGFTHEEQIPRDFFNLTTNEVTCGECKKTMGAFRSLFHFHLTPTKTDKQK